MSDEKNGLSTQEILLEIRDGLKDTNTKVNEIHTQLAVLHSYNVPQIKDDVKHNNDRLTKIETQLKTWAAGAAFLSFVISVLVQQAIESIWRS